MFELFVWRYNLSGQWTDIRSLSVCRGSLYTQSVALKSSSLMTVDSSGALWRNGSRTSEVEEVGAPCFWVLTPRKIIKTLHLLIISQPWICSKYVLTIDSWYIHHMYVQTVDLGRFNCALYDNIHIVLDVSRIRQDISLCSKAHHRLSHRLLDYQSTGIKPSVMLQSLPIRSVFNICVNKSYLTYSTLFWQRNAVGLFTPTTDPVSVNRCQTTTPSILMME